MTIIKILLWFKTSELNSEVGGGICLAPLFINDTPPPNFQTHKFTTPTRLNHKSTTPSKSQISRPLPDVLTPPPPKKNMSLKPTFSPESKKLTKYVIFLDFIKLCSHFADRFRSEISILRNDLSTQLVEWSGMKSKRKSLSSPKTRNIALTVEKINISNVHNNQNNRKRIIWLGSSRNETFTTK